jgi:hypothetical protein
MSDETLPHGFSSTSHVYPSGLHYLVVNYGKTKIGACSIQPDGGYLLFKKRKPVPTLYDAALQMLCDHLNRCQVDDKKWRALKLKLKTGKTP